MRTTATDAAEVLANLMPFHLLISKICLQAALRYATLPDTHPLAKTARRASLRNIKRHRSPMHDLMAMHKTKPHGMEKMSFIRTAAGAPKVFTTIIEDREQAMRVPAPKPGELHIYTDGSGIDNEIGAAATTVPPKGTRKTLRYYLGNANQHTVFEAELIGLILATKIANDAKNLRKLDLLIDNQAAIKALEDDTATARSYLIPILIKALERLKAKNKRLCTTIRWVPGHEGVMGNEVADEEAKKAAKSGSSPAKSLPRFLRKALPLSRTTIRHTETLRIRKQTEQNVMQSRRLSRMKQSDSTIPSDKYQKIVQGLKRNQASVLTQLRMGHIPLAHHLQRIQARESGACETCGRGKETVVHYILHCPTHTITRQKLTKALGRGARNLHNLLSHPIAIPHLLRFIDDTKRLHGVFGTVQPTTDQITYMKGLLERRRKNQRP